MSGAWKALERLVAATMEGTRSFDTDHDVLVVTNDRGTAFDLKAPGGALLPTLARGGAIEIASIECKNLTAPSVAQLERFLEKNRVKADRDGARFSALVVKRKAGPGKKTPALLVVPLEEMRNG